MESITKIITDKQNSVEVGTNARGTYQWTVKAYFNLSESEETLKKVIEIEEALKKKYSGQKIQE